MSPRDIISNGFGAVRRQAVSEIYTHALIVTTVVIAATILAYAGKLQSGDILAVYTGAIGYAAGRSGARPAARHDDSRNGGT